MARFESVVNTVQGKVTELVEETYDLVKACQEERPLSSSQADSPLINSAKEMASVTLNKLAGVSLPFCVVNRLWKTPEDLDPAPSMTNPIVFSPERTLTRNTVNLIKRVQRGRREPVAPKSSGSPQAVQGQVAEKTQDESSSGMMSGLVGAGILVGSAYLLQLNLKRKLIGVAVAAVAKKGIGLITAGGIAKAVVTSSTGGGALATISGGSSLATAAQIGNIGTRILVRAHLPHLVIGTLLSPLADRMLPLLEGFFGYGIAGKDSGVPGGELALLGEQGLAPIDESGVQETQEAEKPKDPDSKESEERFRRYNKIIEDYAEMIFLAMPVTLYEPLHNNASSPNYLELCSKIKNNYPFAIYGSDEESLQRLSNELSDLSDVVIEQAVSLVSGLVQGLIQPRKLAVSIATEALEENGQSGHDLLMQTAETISQQYQKLFDSFGRFVDDPGVALSVRTKNNVKEGLLSANSSQKREDSIAFLESELLFRNGAFRALAEYAGEDGTLSPHNSPRYYLEPVLQATGLALRALNQGSYSYPGQIAELRSEWLWNFLSGSQYINSSIINKRDFLNMIDFNGFDTALADAETSKAENLGYMVTEQVKYYRDSAQKTEELFLAIVDNFEILYGAGSRSQAIRNFKEALRETSFFSAYSQTQFGTAERQKMNQMIVRLARVAQQYGDNQSFSTQLREYVPGETRLVVSKQKIGSNELLSLLDVYEGVLEELSE